MPTPSLFRAGASLVALLALAACGGGGGPSDLGRRLTIDVQGRAERSQVVTVTASAAGVALAPGEVQFTVSPAGAAEALGNGQFRLLREGSLTIDATAQGGLGTTTITVVAPPIVLFDRLDSGNRDIWRVDLDGQNLTRLTSDAGDDRDPTHARGRVVFVSFRSGNGELWEVPLAGGAATRLTTTPGNETTPALSPDGARLAYVYDATGVTKLWTAAGNGTGGARALDDGFGFGGSIETSPAWAPTGTRLVFVATASGSADLWNVTLPGAPSLLTGGDAAEVEPSWSPDASQVAFASNRATPGTGELFLLTVSTGAVTRLTTTTASESQPVWTSDGRLVFVENQGGVSRLRWMDPAQPATTHPIETGTGSALRPTVAAPGGN